MIVKKLCCYFILFVVLMFAAVLSGCANDSSAAGEEGEAASFSQEETRMTAATSAGRDKNPITSLAVFTREPTFYNSIGELPADLPTVKLSDILTSFGVSSNTPTGYFVSELAGKNFYSLDLSALEPLYYTTEKKLVCKLKSDVDTDIIIVLDSPVPSIACYYFCSTWELPEQASAYRIDGKLVENEEKNRCETMFQVHTRGTGYQRAAILDGDPRIRLIKATFEKYVGLTYCFPVYIYSIAENVVYSVIDDTLVYVPNE